MICWLVLSISKTIFMLILLYQSRACTKNNTHIDLYGVFPKPIYVMDLLQSIWCKPFGRSSMCLMAAVQAGWQHPINGAGGVISELEMFLFSVIFVPHFNTKERIAFKFVSFFLSYSGFGVPTRWQKPINGSKRGEKTQETVITPIATLLPPLSYRSIQLPKCWEWNSGNFTIMIKFEILTAGILLISAILTIPFAVTELALVYALWCSPIPTLRMWEF